MNHVTKEKVAALCRLANDSSAPETQQLALRFLEILVQQNIISGNFAWEECARLVLLEHKATGNSTAFCIASFLSAILERSVASDDRVYHSNVHSRERVDDVEILGDCEEVRLIEIAVNLQQNLQSVAIDGIASMIRANVLSAEDVSCTLRNIIASIRAVGGSSPQTF